ncbi:MAG: hypothetical protein ABSG76_14070, partial [Xanthobacteraceae bacterium]
MNKSASLRRILFATSSAVALIAVHAGPAHAACQVGTTSGINNSNNNPAAATITCLLFNNITVNTNALNAGNITPGSPFGVKVNGGTFNGSIINTGTISTSAGGGSANGIWVFGAVLTGGINNSGIILAPSGAGGILISNVTSSVGGGITNAGTITSTQGQGIQFFTVSTFTGGITNTGTITSHSSSIRVRSVSSFSGGNSGTMVVGKTGILVGSSPTKLVSFFAGGITNSGIITAYGATGNGIVVDVSTFAGG